MMLFCTMNIGEYGIAIGLLSLNARASAGIVLINRRHINMGLA